MNRVLESAAKNPLRVLLFTVVIAGLGVWSYSRLPIDAVPDLTNVQVQVNTGVPGLSPLEVERQVTFPIERVMSGIPHLERVRSISRFGLSQLTLIFEDGTDIYWARQLVGERLAEAKESLPPGLGEPKLGPIATGLGEIYFWSVEAEGPKRDGSPYSLSDLRSIQDWLIKPQMRTVPGVNEINSIGGYEKQYLVLPDPAKLRAFDLSFQDVVDRLAENNANVGASYIEHNGEQYLVRSAGLIEALGDIRRIVLGSYGGIPICVGDVAEVATGNELRTGAAVANGHETVIGTAIMLLGANSRTVSSSVGERLAKVNERLPENVRARTIYDRTYLVDATVRTVQHNLLEGAVLVLAVLLALLGNLRGAFIVALSIPLSMLFAITGMVQTRTSANLMSLGAIDFGLIVDGSVVMVENILRRLGVEQKGLGRPLSRAERVRAVIAAAKEVARPTLFGVGIIMIVYLPVLTLSGIEGKMFRPMAAVILLALAGALILAFTLVPTLCVLGLRGRVAESETFVIRWVKRLYRPTLEFCLAHRGLVVTVSLAVLGFSALLASRLGSEFVPRLREGAFAMEVRRIPSVSVPTSVEMQKHLETSLLERFPDEVEEIFATIGTAEITMDPMGPNTADTYIMLQPRDRWKLASSYDELARKMEDVLDENPGDTYEFSQPIELRVNELVAGVKSDLAIKVFGDDLEQMRSSAARIAEVLATVSGAVDVKVEQTVGLPLLDIDVDRASIARYGLNVSDVQRVVQIAVGGESAGEVYEGDARYDLVVRLPASMRNDIDRIENLLIPLPRSEVDTGSARSIAFEGESGAMSEEESGYVPLAAVASVAVTEGANVVNREDGKRRIVVTCNARGRDLGSLVAEAQRRIDAEVSLPAGQWLGWGGQFENLIAARARLSVVVPIALLLIFLMLFSTFGSLRLAALVFVAVPLALTGGVFALVLRGMPFSITAGVGFIALSGVAVLNGLVMVSFIRSLRANGLSLRDAVIEGSIGRLRPVLMTGLVASLGFVPMALATSMGAEVQRPLATVVIGGIVSSTLLTLCVLPALYAWFDGRFEGYVRGEGV